MTQINSPDPSPLILSAPLEIRALYWIHFGVAVKAVLDSFWGRCQGYFPADQLIRIHLVIIIRIKFGEWVYPIFRSLHQTTILIS